MEQDKKRFAIIGCAGYIAPRHLKAIKDTGNELVCALDKTDSVGILDSYSYDIDFFTEFERFDRHLEKLKQKGEKIDFISICTPNYLHDAHIRYVLRHGASAICEKPLVITPSNLDALEQIEKETGKRVYGITQLRLHPVIKELKQRIERDFSDKKYEVELIYVATRGKWYLYSWKGDESKSGGLAMNLGVHLFDMLLWIFGKVEKFEVYESTPTKIRGKLNLEKANVKWMLSCDKKELPQEAIIQDKKTYRSIKVNKEEIEFSEGFTELHTKSYEEILAGRGFGISDTRGAIELIDKIRNAKLTKEETNSQNNFFAHESVYIDENVGIGDNTKIWYFSHILKNTKIGKDCIIGQNVMIGPDVEVGNNCKIQNNVSVYKGVTLKDKVFCGPSCVFTNVANPRAFIDRRSEFKETIVEEGATIGANATIVCGNKIGKYSLIGAGAVVTEDVPDYALVVGVPAKQIGWVCECGEILSKDTFDERELRCKKCNSKIFKNTGEIEKTWSL